MLTKRFLSNAMNYAPGLIILVFGMLALHFSVLLIETNQILSDPSGLVLYYTEGQRAELEEAVRYSETWFYWSVIAMGLSGFVLVLLNADKLSKLQKMNVEKEKADEEKEKLQGQFYQAQKMEAVGRLAGGVAHDFNNILAAMNGYAEFLTEDLEEGSKEQEFAQNILKAGHQARDLVDQMLAFSRRSDSNVQIFDLANPVHETMSMLQASLPKSIEMQAEIDVDSAPVAGNATQISQVIMNLCVNAKDAMADEKGILKIGLKTPWWKTMKALICSATSCLRQARHRSSVLKSWAGKERVWS